MKLLSALPVSGVRGGLQILVCLSACTIAVVPSFSEPKKIDEAEAVKIAEQFIADNGYTDAPPRVKHPAPESLSRRFTESGEFSLRHNSLEPKAYGVIYGARDRPGGWTIVFLYSKKWRTDLPSIDKDRVGRALRMDAYGGQIMIEHKDIFLKAVERKL